MKTFISILLAVCLIGCTITAPVPPPEPPVVVVPPTPEPPKPPVVKPTGSYIITQFDENGVKVHEWEVDDYTERSFPNRVTFVYDGQVITVDGSFQIDRKLK